MSCFIRQARDAAGFAGADSGLLGSVAKKAQELISAFDPSSSPPESSVQIYDMVAEIMGKEDIYKEVKLSNNRMALALYPELKNTLRSARDPLLLAVRMAVAGNIIDYGVSHVFDVKKELEQCADRDFAVFDYKAFREEVSSARNILYLLDNAGEIVMDKLLIETMGKNVTAVVREGPIINDVTIEDAVYIGLDKVCRVISSGCRAPGTILEKCNEELIKCYNTADMVISKGQGNFETLAGSAERRIFFIFKAKCPVVAKYVGCDLGDILLKVMPAVSL